MLRVQIHINRDKIIDIYAQRMEGFKGENFTHLYHGHELVDIGGKVEPQYMGNIKHKYSSGGEELAVKLLRLYKKEGQEHLMYSEGNP